MTEKEKNKPPRRFFCAKTALAFTVLRLSGQASTILMPRDVVLLPAPDNGRSAEAGSILRSERNGSLGKTKRMAPPF
jgi:hypothetical protein